MLMRFDPFADMDRLSRQVWGGQRGTYMPADAYRVGDRVFLHIDLPGVAEDSIDVTIENDTLTVSAERRWNREDESKVLISERPFGSYTRRFFLGEQLDSDRIEAGYDRGVLTVTIPVAEAAQPRKIEVGAVHQLTA